ncbi:MAG: T9SS type A sorting domain-containing protein [Bacteroidetes bacterium]|nr:T9SS type A sorting domain-containing protein [Bacteroidota bacterium]
MRRIITSLPSLVSILCLSLFSIQTQAQDDAGIAGITQPASTVCRGNANVEATLHNYGAVNITTCTVQWTVNGVLQAPFSYSGTLTPGSDATVTLGNYIFNAGAYAIVAYSENPNGNTDSDNSNDTSATTVNTQLNGTYTIGGTTPDYSNFAGAVNDLNNFGVCGAVIFNVRAGTYNEKLVINQVAGASATNTITFQSETGDSSSVILNTPSVDSTLANNYLIRLNGTDYLTLKQMTLSRSGISANARILDYTQVASFNIVTNCHLLGVSNGITANSLGALVYSSGGTPFNDSMNTFSNNLFENGSIGIYFNGVGTLSLENGTSLTDNQFVNQFAFAMQLAYDQAPLITGNFITSNSNHPGYTGIYLSACLRNTIVSKNQLSSCPGNGFYFIDCGAFPVPRGTVSNNFVNTTDSSGITLLNGGNLDIVYNSIHVQDVSAGSSALALRGVNYGMVVKNNALVNSGGGYAYLIADSGFAGLVSSDYNDLYTTGSNVGSYRGTDAAGLADWQIAAAHDTNSISADPAFVSASNLHATSIGFDNKGTSLAGILVDIDNDLRSATTPDIGADEYTGMGHDVAVVTMLSPLNNDCENAAAVVSVVVHNYGAFTETNISVQTDVTGAFTATLNGSISSLAPGLDSTLSFATTLNTTGGGDATFTAYTQLATDDNHSNDTLNSGIIHINPIPALPTVSNDSICGPGSVTLNATSSDTLFWYDVATGGISIGQGSPFNTPNISTTTTYYVEARNFCSSGRVAVDAIIMPLPNINLGNDTSILLGSSITLDAGAGFAIYVWSTGETNQTITQSPVLPTCYNVTVLDNNGCANADTICVNVVFPSNVGIQSLVTPTDHQCENAATPITVLVANYGSNTATDIPIQIDITGAINVSFNDTLFGSIPAGGSIPFTIDSTINTAGGGTFNITAYTVYASDQSSGDDTLISVININHVPLAPVGTDNARCGAGAITLTGTATDTIYWYDAPVGGNLLGIGTYNIPFLATTTTYYAQTGFSCPSLTRDSVTATIYNLPVIDLGPDTLIVCGDTITLDAGAGYSMYLWSNSATTQTIDVDTLGDYSVMVIDTNGCANQDTLHVDCYVGITALNAMNNVNVYPNPSTGIITVELGRSTSSATIRWIDLEGRLISEDVITGIHQKNYDLTSVRKGVYLLQVISGDGVSVHRVIIQ